MTTDNSVMTHQMFVTAYVTQLIWDVNEGESVSEKVQNKFSAEYPKKRTVDFSPNLHLFVPFPKSFSIIYIINYNSIILGNFLGQYGHLFKDAWRCLKMDNKL